MSTIKENINAYAKDINEASEDERIRTAITRAIASYRKNLAEALERYPHTPISGNRGAEAFGAWTRL